MNTHIKRGFTLIELLIVIVIIGVLATTLIAAINPIEQINKSRDAAKGQDAAALVSALERYYSSYEEWPWDDTGYGAGTDPAAPGTGTGTAVASQTWLTNGTWGVIGRGELKAGFNNRTSVASLVIWYDSTNQQPVVCYNPVSKAGDAKATRLANGSVGSPAVLVCVPE